MDKKLEELVKSSYEKIKEIYDAPHAAKVNMMQTDGKLAINVLNFYRTLRQSESGKEQAMAVIAKMLHVSKEDIAAFLEANLPELKFPKKELPEKREKQLPEGKKKIDKKK